jgi:hypothetical protein
MNAGLTVYANQCGAIWISFAACVFFGAEQTTYKPNRGPFPATTFGSNSVSDRATLATAEP